MDFTFFTALFGTLIFFLILFGNIYLSHKKHYDEKVSNCNMSVEGKVLKIVSSYRKIDGELVFTYYPVMGYQVDGKDYAIKSEYGYENADTVKVDDSLEIKLNPNNLEDFLLSNDEYHKVIKEDLNQVLYIFGVLCVSILVCLYTIFR